MIRTEILCPECMKKKLLKETEENGYCDHCGSDFIITGPNTVRYKKKHE